MSLLEGLESMIAAFNEILWGWPMMVILVGFGIFSTFYLKFPQVRHLGKGFKEMWSGITGRTESDEGTMSSFQALATAVGSQVGTGNIAGVATAIISGGPGAVFWMWITALVGMATIFVEATLGQQYSETRNGELVGGPAFYLRRGLNNQGKGGLGKALALIFSILIIIALGFIGNAVQSNSIATSMQEAFGFNPALIGLIIVLLTGLIVVGGIDRIKKVAEYVVPFMAVLYVVLAVIILVQFSDMILPVLKAIVMSAFSSHALLGGAAGYGVQQAIRYGIARGLFSNEAGMGSTPNSYAVAKVNHPIIQANVAMVGVFIDTLVVCTATAMVILVTGGNVIGLELGLEGAGVTMLSFSQGFGVWGDKLIAIMLFFMAFTTLIGWYYFAENNIKYLTSNKLYLKLYQIVVLVFIFIGSISNISIVWELADLFNGLMVIPNIIGILFLIKEVKELENDYTNQLETGERLKYDYKYR